MHTLFDSTPLSAFQEQLDLSPGTRAFLDDLFRRLAESLRPADKDTLTAKTRFLEAHLGVPQKDQASVTRVYPAWASNHVLVAVQRVVTATPNRTGAPVDFDYDGDECVASYRPVPVTPDETRDVPSEAYCPSFHGDTPFVAAVSHDRDGLHVTIYVRSDDRAIGLALLEQVDAQPNFYRGQVITLEAGNRLAFVQVPPTSFEEDLVLEPSLETEIERQVVHFVEREPLFRAVGIPFRRGVLLVGPPGVGKTQVFRALSHRLAGRCTILWLTSRAVENPEGIASIFALARSLAPTVLLWEDLDLTVRNRAAGNGSLLGELLAQLDGAQSNEGVITCASTNDAAALDEALSQRPSRFDCVLHIGPPSRETRLRMLRRFSQRIPRLQADLDVVADSTAGLSGAHLKELVTASFTQAVNGSLGTASADELPVTTDHFLAALESVRATSAREDRWQHVWNGRAR